jgi:hypothetical protein
MLELKCRFRRSSSSREKKTKSAPSTSSRDPKNPLRECVATFVTIRTTPTLALQ